jgi:hypothetical protein
MEMKRLRQYPQCLRTRKMSSGRWLRYVPKTRGCRMSEALRVPSVNDSRMMTVSTGMQTIEMDLRAEMQNRNTCYGVQDDTKVQGMELPGHVHATEICTMSYG